MTRRKVIASRALLRDHQFTPFERDPDAPGVRQEVTNRRARAGRARARGVGSGTCQGCGLPCEMYYCPSCSVNLGGEG